MENICANRIAPVRQRQTTFRCQCDLRVVRRARAQDEAGCDIAARKTVSTKSEFRNSKSETMFEWRDDLCLPSRSLGEGYDVASRARPATSYFTARRSVS